jgi:hypothetical protein
MGQRSAARSALKLLVSVGPAVCDLSQTPKAEVTSSNLVGHANQINTLPRPSGLPKVSHRPTHRRLTSKTAVSAWNRRRLSHGTVPN